VAAPDLLGSATEVAVMATFDGVGMVAGAVYKPDALIVPTVVFPPCAPPALQVTAVLLVPLTAAVYCCVPPGTTLAVRGETETTMLCAVAGEEVGELGEAVFELPLPLPHETVRNAMKTSWKHRTMRNANRRIKLSPTRCWRSQMRLYKGPTALN
jgi:hypothetical protein